MVKRKSTTRYFPTHYVLGIAVAATVLWVALSELQVIDRVGQIIHQWAR